MATPPRYAQRVARLPQVFAVLQTRPEGMPLADLASGLGISADELREDLLAYFTADIGGMLGLSRPATLDFRARDGSDVDPGEAEIVQLIDDRPTEELGVEFLDASELALIYTAAQGLAELEPENAELAEAIAVLTQTMVGGTDRVESTVGSSDTGSLDLLHGAVAERRRLRLQYSRSWFPGVSERVVEPYQLIRTHRGWELDAAVADSPTQEGLRTYLVDRIRTVELLEESFEPPARLAELLADQRRTTEVRVRIPYAARWAAERYAEQVVVLDEDEETVTAVLHLLPPVERRVGLLLLVAGPDAAVLAPGAMIAAGPRLAADLLEHHRALPEPGDTGS